MKKIFTAMLAVLLLLLAAVPALASLDDQFEHMYINCANGKTLNLRDAPNGKIITRLDNGTKVYISGGFIEKGWVAVTVEVKDRNNLTKQISGFVKSEFLQSKKPGKFEITEREDNFVEVGQRYVVTANPLSKKTTQSVGLRVKPNKTSKAIRRLEAGDELEVLATAKIWIMVLDYKTGETGYVAEEYTTFDRFLPEEEEEPEEEPYEEESGDDYGAE